MAQFITASIPFLKKVTGNKVFKNISYLTVGTVVSQALSLLAVLKLTHIILPGDYGLFTFLVAQGALLLTISNLGTTNVFIRSIARDPSRTNDLVFNGMIFRLGALLLLIPFYALYNHYFGSLTIVQVCFIFFLTLVGCLYNLSENVFYGNQKMFAPSVVNLVYSLMWFTVVYFYSAHYSNVSSLFLIYLVLNTVKAAVSIIVLKSNGLLNGKINNFWKSSASYLKESWPFFTIIMIMLPITSLANNFLDLNSNLNEVGYFNLSQRLIGPVSMVVSIVFAAIFPNLSALWIANESRFYRLVRIGFVYFMLFTLLLCFMFNLFAQEVVNLLFPAKYLPALPVCRMQVWYLFLTSVDSLIGTILAATNREKLILRFSMIYCLFCTPVFFYASRFGAFGLACGYVISFSVCLLYVWHTFKRVLKLQVPHSNSVWLLFAFFFLLSYFIPEDLSIYAKFVLVLTILTGVVFYYKRLILLRR